MTDERARTATQAEGKQPYILRDMSQSDAEDEDWLAHHAPPGTAPQPPASPSQEGERERATVVYALQRLAESSYPTKYLAPDKIADLIERMPSQEGGMREALDGLAVTEAICFDRVVRQRDEAREALEEARNFLEGELEVREMAGEPPHSEYLAAPRRLIERIDAALAQDGGKGKDEPQC